MAWEKGILTDIETAAIAVLIALDDDAETPAPLFKNIEKSEGTNQQKSGYKKCVDHWLGQIGLRDGGVSSFDRYCPFAFVRGGFARIGREGDYDANLRLTLDIAVGQQSSEDGIARIGDATHVGTNRIVEKVFHALNGWHPGSEIDCDDFYITDAIESLAMPKMHGVQLHFEANWIPVS